MVSTCFYFQVHQPYRLKPYSPLDIGRDLDYFDEPLNRAVAIKVAEKCYLPANRLFLDLIERYEGAFKISYSITGTAVEQFRRYAPEVLDSFRDLAQSGCVEFLCETYYHSLTSLYKSKTEFREQVAMHSQKIEELFGVRPVTFRNTELPDARQPRKHQCQQPHSPPSVINPCFFLSYVYVKGACVSTAGFMQHVAMGIVGVALGS